MSILPDLPPLSPFATPMCQTYLHLYNIWIQQTYKGGSWIKAYNKMSQHRASCELCRKRMEELNELARNARELDVEG